MPSSPIRKAVLPVAGLGSRFLPATKANPKEMLPIVDKPLIQYAVEEAIQAGCTEMIFITSSSKRSIEDHFDKNFELEMRLAEQNKQVLLQLTRNILPTGISCVYLRQPDPRGLGDAILQAKTVVADEPFAVLLADDLIDACQPNCLQQMQAIYQQTGSHVIAVERVLAEQTPQYGIVSCTSMEHHQSVYTIDAIVEKPPPQQAPSRLGVAGRYILNPSIFSALEQTEHGTGGEIQLTDAIDQLLTHEPGYALEFTGARYDCGNKLGYLQATLAWALKHPELAEPLQRYLRTLQCDERLL